MKADVFAQPQGRNTSVPEFAAGHAGFVLAFDVNIKSSLLHYTSSAFSGLRALKGSFI